MDSFPYALAAGPGGLFAGLRDGRIYRSEVRGDRWELLDTGSGRPSCVLAMALIPGLSEHEEDGHHDR